MGHLRKFLNRKGQSTPHLYRDVKALTFWALMKVDGKIRKKSLETTDYVEAVSKLPAALADLAAAAGDDDRARKLAADAPAKLVKDYWAELTRKKDDEEQAEATNRRRTGVWENHLKDFWGNLRPAEIGPNTITDYLAWHRKRKPGVQYVNIYKYLGMLLSDMCRQGAIEQKNMPQLVLSKKERLHHDKQKGRTVEPGELKRLIAAAEGEMALRFSIHHTLGLRKMELGELKPEQVRILESGRVILVFDTDDTKTGLAREVPLTAEQGALMIEQMKTRGNSDWVFPNLSGTSFKAATQVDDEWAALKERAKIQTRLRFHDLRHHAATEMARRKMNPMMAVTILGMSYQTYQKKYLKLTGEDLIMEVDRIAGTELS